MIFSTRRTKEISCGESRWSGAEKRVLVETCVRRVIIELHYVSMAVLILNRLSIEHIPYAVMPLVVSSLVAIPYARNVCYQSHCEEHRRALLGASFVEAVCVISIMSIPDSYPHHELTVALLSAANAMRNFSSELANIHIEYTSTSSVCSDVKRDCFLAVVTVVQNIVYISAATFQLYVLQRMDWVDTHLIAAPLVLVACVVGLLSEWWCVRVQEKCVDGIHGGNGSRAINTSAKRISLTELLSPQTTPTTQLMRSTVSLLITTLTLPLGIHLSLYASLHPNLFLATHDRHDDTVTFMMYVVAAASAAVTSAVIMFVTVPMRRRFSNATFVTISTIATANLAWFVFGQDSSVARFGWAAVVLVCVAHYVDSRWIGIFVHESVDGTHARWSWLSVKRVTGVAFISITEAAVLLLSNAYDSWRVRLLFWVGGSAATTFSFYVLLALDINAITEDQVPPGPRVDRVKIHTQRFDIISGPHNEA